jgi:hypothetical protein
MDMSEWKLPWQGGCRCDRVRFEISLPPLLTMACHCTGCQRMSASAFSLSVAVPTSGFAVKTGEPVIGGLHGNPSHYFCPYCLSWMFTRPEGLDFVNVRATLLDNPRWIEPYIETYTSEKLAWSTTPAVHKYPKFPPPEAYGTLISEFAQNSPRP